MSSVLTSRAAVATSLSLFVALGCNLTKKEDGSSTPGTTTVLPAAPVFTVAMPQPAATEPQAPLPQPEQSIHSKAKGGTGGTSAVHSGAAGHTSKTGSGGASTVATTAKTGTGGTAAKATTAASGTGGHVMVYGGPRATGVNVACLSACGTKLQTCVTAAGVDPARLGTCQQAFTTCQSKCGH
jgi:hypothetical protein